VRVFIPAGPLARISCSSSSTIITCGYKFPVQTGEFSISLNVMRWDRVGSVTERCLKVYTTRGRGTMSGVNICHVIKSLPLAVSERKARYSILLPIAQANHETTHTSNNWPQHAEDNIRYRNREARDDRDSRSARYVTEQDSYPSFSTSVEPRFNSSVS
jgi:hypothetical protein